MNFYKKGGLYVPDYNQVFKIWAPAPELPPCKGNGPFIRITPPNDLPISFTDDDLPKADASRYCEFRYRDIYFRDQFGNDRRVDCWEFLG